MRAVGAFLFFSVATQAQEVIRWGSAPGTVDPEGFRVTAFTWEESSSLEGASTFQLGIDDVAIRVPQIVPDLNLATLGRANLGYADHSAIFDGDPETTWRDIGFTCDSLWGGREICDDVYASLGTYEIDFGVLLPVDRIVIMSGLDDPGLIVPDFRVHVRQDLPSQALRLGCCPLLRPVLVDVRDNRSQVREVRLNNLEPIRFMQIAVGQREEGWEIHEVQVFGSGFVSNSEYVSNIVEFDGPMAWGQLRWSGFESEGAHVRLQTRTGADPDPQRYWRFTGRDDDRIEVTREQYESLKVGERAGTTYDRSSWSFWSAVYDFADSSGAVVVSPSPRRYFQFKVDLEPGAEGSELGHLGLETWPPLASALVGEVWPIDSEVGQWREYSYIMRPTIVAEDDGFDRLEISSLALLGGVHDVRVGDEAVPWKLEEKDPHRLVLDIPHLQTSDSGVLVQVDFDAQVLRYGSTFDGRVWISDQTPLTPQRVNPGDATGEFEGNRVSVATSVQDEALLRVDIPAAVTPNGDGVNDQLQLAYEIFEVIGESTVRIDVFDLAGRRVRRVHEGTEGVGRYERSFDGRDDGGQLLPPGVYLARVELATDEADNARHTEIVHVVY